MAPAKSRVNHDDSKSEAPSHKDKTAHGGGNNQPNGKSRRVAGTGASHAREAQSASAPGTAPTAQEVTAPGVSGYVGIAASPCSEMLTRVFLQLQWASFDRGVLHAYRRVYRLNTPSAFANEYHQRILSQPGSIGLQSPTMARRRDQRRQSKDQLANTVRKHFNGLGTQENDVIVDFLHKIRSQGISKPEPTKRSQYSAPNLER
jgi:histone deacetylase complex subunit SAP30